MPVEIKVLKWSFTAEVRAEDDMGAAKGTFANGFVAIVWRQGRHIHAKLYDKAGNEIGSQYGNRIATYFSTWTFYHAGIEFRFNVVG